MAAATNQENTKTKAADTERRGPPAGFNNETRPDIEGWVAPADGVIVHAKIHSMIGFKDDDGKFREVFIIKLLEPLKCKKKGDVEVELKAGSIAGMSMNYALSPLREYVTKQGTFWVEFVKQEKIGGGRKVWKVNLHAKGEKTAPYFVPRQSMTGSAAAADDAGSDDDNIPF